MTVTEALWKERPVVATAVGGIPLQVISGKTGYLVHTIDGTASAIKRVLDNPAEAKRRAAKAHQQARDRFHPLVIAKRHVEIYREVLSKPS